MAPAAAERAAALEIEVKPPCPFRLSSRGRMDGVARFGDGVLTRLMHIGHAPVVVHAWQRRDGAVAIRAHLPGVELSPLSGGNRALGSGEDTSREMLERAVERIRFAIAVDDDLWPFYREFKRDPLLGPAIRRRPWLRPKRRPFAWEALQWAVTEQLIESSRAAQIQRRMVRRWGRTCEWEGKGAERGPLTDVPAAEAVAALAPAELASCDLAPARSVALIKCAREIATGRADPGDPGSDGRFLRIGEIGPWTLRCLGLFGRGEPDSLPAGDLAYVKYVGVVAGLGRRATVPEVERFYAPYAGYRGLAGIFSLGNARGVSSLARGLPLAPDAYADAA